MASYAGEVAAADALSALGGLYQSEGNATGAIEVYEKAQSEFPQHPARRSWLMALGKLYRDQGKAEESAQRYVQAIVTDPTNLAQCIEAQLGILDTLIFAGRYKEAVGEAKMLFALSTLDDRACQAALSAVGRALKARDGHMSNAVRFVNFQKYGQVGPDGQPNTGDDVTNPLAEVSVDADSIRGKACSEALAALGEDGVDLRQRGCLQLLQGKPDLALESFTRVFETCEMNGAAINQAARDIVLALNAQAASVRGAEAWLEFQKYGPAGADGKVGTADDLTDPLPK